MNVHCTLLLHRLGGRALSMGGRELSLGLGGRELSLGMGGRELSLGLRGREQSLCLNCRRVVRRRILVIDWREHIWEYLVSLCLLQAHHVQVGGRGQR